MPFEDDFALALRDAAELAPEPVSHTALAAGAERRGRRGQQRRRAAVAGGLAVLLLAAGGVAALGGGVVNAGPAGPPLPSMSTDEVVALVTGLLPEGKVTVLNAGGTGGGKLPGHEYGTGATLLFDDGKGASIFSFSASRTELTPEAGAVCADPFSTPQDSCDRATRPDGSVVVIDKLRSRPPEGDHREWRATWAAPDGRRVSVTEYNGQPATPNRDAPPLDDGQLTALLTSPAWEQVFAALPLRPDAPKPQKASAPPSTEATPPVAEVLAKLVPLLPPGTTQSEVKGGGAANLLVTSEGRASLLSVTVGPPGTRGLEDKRYAESEGSAGPLAVREKRADGSTVVVNQFGNGKTATQPVLHWTAAVYYADGRQVMISEQNGENGYTARPGTPALSLDQLKAIVTAPVWRS